MKHTLRKTANALARHTPKPLVRYWLKSYWYQPELQDAIRYHVQPYRYDSAIPTRLDLDLERLKKRRSLPGLKLDPERSLQLLDELFPYAAEITSFPLEQKAGEEFWFRNHFYEELDAVSLYCMIRHFKPRRIIEAGCGFSSRVISLAARKNAADGRPVACTFIEPYPTDRILRDRLAGPLLEKKIEDVPPATFRELQAGDFLFIDTSHVIKTQNDCCYEYLELLPCLNPGVILHVHDIFTPYDYPEEWITQKLFALNEQYALECLMSGNPSLEIILPLHYLWKDYFPSLARFFPAQPGRPAAFWLRMKSPVK
jgi:predicted O-methyltransferase YrrM